MWFVWFEDNQQVNIFFLLTDRDNLIQFSCSCYIRNVWSELCEIMIYIELIKYYVSRVTFSKTT